jgi:hypothetical protein
MFTIYPYTKFYVFISNSQSISAIEPKAEDNFCMTTMFYILQKCYINKICIFF